MLKDMENFNSSKEESVVDNKLKKKSGDQSNPDLLDKL